MFIIFISFTILFAIEVSLSKSIFFNHSQSFTSTAHLNYSDKKTGTNFLFIYYVTDNIDKIYLSLCNSQFVLNMQLRQQIQYQAKTNNQFQNMQNQTIQFAAYAMSFTIGIFDHIAKLSANKSRGINYIYLYYNVNNNDY